MEERTVNILIYVLVTLAIGVGGTVALMRGGRSVAGIIYLIGAILIFVFFGLRWFVYSTPKWQPKSWPPNINTCPDFLVFMQADLNGTPQDTCIDVQGVSTKPDVLKCWPKDGRNPLISTDPGFYFNKTKILASVDASNPVNVRRALANAAIEAGVSWEGICDGLEPTGFDNGSDGGGGGSGCPANTAGTPPANMAAGGK
jgi:hypothetical protein